MLAEPQPPTVTSGRKPGKSAAERKRLQRLRERETAPIFYSTPDWRVFTSWQTLQQKAGCQPDKLRKIIIKELVDNALDAGANVSLEFVDGTWMITDDGAGLDPDDVPHLFCVNRSLQSTKLRRMPLRGMLGNGLRVVMGAVAASNETVVVETRGHRLTLRVCSDTGHTLVVSDQVRPHTPGVTVFLTYTNADTDDGNFARSSIAMAKVGKHYTGPSSPWWYGPDDLYHLFKAVTPPDTTVGALCDSLGLSLDDDRSAQTLNLMDAELVLNKLRNAARPISPEELGYLGRGIKPGEHARQNGIHVTTSGAKIPYVVEAWATCNRSPYKGYGDIYIQTILNRSHTLAQITAEWRSHSIHISGCGLNQSIKTPGTGSYQVMLSVITPHIRLATDGKEPALGPFSAAIAQVLLKTCSLAHRAMGPQIGGFTVKDAAYQVMDDAYARASNNGSLPANARQIMYSARPEILQLTGKDQLDDAYFTQTLLPNYIAEQDKIGWNVVYDSRGGFVEPHTGFEVRLGTIDIRSYLGDRPELGPVMEAASSSYPTRGPDNRYKSILCIEKEGFSPLLQAARIAERFDIAIMSSKGMSTTAARELLDRLTPKIDKILVMHDLDISGFSIFGTLCTTARRYTFKNTLPIVDIGLRLDDIEQMGLQSEPVETTGNWNSRRKTLRSHGATADEINFLRTKRVELNAMPSDGICSTPNQSGF